MRVRPALAAVALLAAAACSDGRPERAAQAAVSSTTASSTTTSTTVPEPAEPWPVPDWEVVEPAAVGLDPTPLDAMAAKAGDGASACLVVTKDGQLVREWYWGGATPTTAREAFSVTKSITATLVGIAADRGLLALDDRVSRFVPEWEGTESAEVTVRNLIAMDSGRFIDIETDYRRMAGQAEDKTAFSIALDQEHPPGTHWAYNNAAVQVLERVLEVATGQDVGDFADDVLFEPLGMSTTIRRDTAGNTLTFMGAQATCRDLARFGLLYLREGEWNGTEIVSRAFVEDATQPSQLLNPAYGYLWWLGDGGDDEEPTDVYAAIGLNQQYVVVDPSSGVVVTRLGDRMGPTGGTFGLGDVTDAVAAALGEG